MKCMSLWPLRFQSFESLGKQSGLLFYIPAWDTSKIDPIDADANGAYNIAQKGLWAVRQIKACTDEKPKLAISNAEWLIFAQENPLNPNG